MRRVAGTAVYYFREQSGTIAEEVVWFKDIALAVAEIG